MFPYLVQANLTRKLMLYASLQSLHVLFHQAKQQKVERPGASDRGKWCGEGGSPKKSIIKPVKEGASFWIRPD